MSGFGSCIICARDIRSVTRILRASFDDRIAGYVSRSVCTRLWRLVPVQQQQVPQRRLFAPQERGRIGSTIVEGGEKWLEPRLQVHAPLGYDFGDGPTRTTEVIGYGEIGDGLLLIDGGRRAR